MILRSNYNNKNNPWFWLEGESAEIKIKIAKYTCEWSPEQVSQVQFCDDHNRHISEAGQYLLRLQGEYLLASDEQILVSAEHPVVAFAHEFNHAELKAKVGDLIGLRLFEPLLKTKITQFSLQLRDDEKKCVSRAHFVKTEQGAFVQLDPIRGYDKAAKQLRKVLVKQGFTETSTLFTQHIFRALASELPELTSLVQPDIEPDEAVGDVVCKMCQHMLTVARSHEQGILEKPEDTEFLHDYRVSLRKTRSLVSLMKNIFPPDIHGQMKNRLAELMRPTNLARDLDVYLLEQSDYEQMLPQNLRGGLPAMFNDFRKQHKTAYEDLHNSLKSRAYETEMESCIAFFEGMNADQLGEAAREPVLPAINRLVKKKYCKVLRLGEIITPESPDEEVHDLRLECKKFRYLLEFFGPLYPSKKLSQLVKNLKKMQNTLGLFNDYSVQQEALHHYLSKARQNKKLHMSVGALILVLAQKQVEQRSLVERKFAEFASKDTAMLVQELFSSGDIKDANPDSDKKMIKKKNKRAGA